jgi:hypothetical protein
MFLLNLIVLASRSMVMEISFDFFLEVITLLLIKFGFQSQVGGQDCKRYNKLDNLIVKEWNMKNQDFGKRANCHEQMRSADLWELTIIRSEGIENIAAWAYLGLAFMNHKCEDHLKVWDILGRSFGKIRSG